MSLHTGAGTTPGEPGAAALGSTRADTGLSRPQVEDRVRRGLVNDVPRTPSRTTWQIVRANVFTPFNALLGGLLVVILIFGPIQDALFGGVLIANTAIGIYQELRAKRTLDRLAVLTAPRARVVREGDVSEIGMDGVVMDDVLELHPGDQVVVDGSVLATEGLEADESLLTGESDPVVKEPGDEVLSGSFVAAGTGRYRATRVGAEAYASALAEQARRFTLVDSELRNGINSFIKYIAIAMVPTAGLLLWSQLRSNDTLAAAVRGTVAGVVAMVPEGLVLLTSIAFAASVVRLARRQVLVQELPAVEVLARVDVLCIDKTGTITEGRLELESVEPLGDEDAESARQALGTLAASDPNPNATLRAIGQACPPPDVVPVPTETVPFSSARKWSAVSFDGTGTWILGAPDVLLTRDDTNGDLPARVERYAESGRRLVLLATSADPLDGEALPDRRTAVALVVLNDRVRPDAAETIRYFGEQGVTVKVISGDHPATVATISSDVGVRDAAHAADARDLPDDPEGLAAALDENSVFGRVTPRQKQSMVEALHRRGHVVAMTGDGVNDVLALKDADLGIAMGSGSPASRAVAQLVLLDGRFSSMPGVVAEGRRVLANIERTSNLFLTKTVYAMVMALAVGVLTFPFPFLPRHLTLVGSLTIGIPAFFLALMPNTRRARPGMVLRVLRFAVPAGFVVAVATLAAYLLVKNHAPGATLAQARTTATIVLFWLGIIVLVVVARPLTAFRRAVVWTMIGLFAAVLAIPGLREFFDLQLPSLIVSFAAVGIAAIFATGLELLLSRMPGQNEQERPNDRVGEDRG